MKINLNLLPIKLHYFLRYSATASLGLFLPVIIRQKGVTPQEIGLIWTALPFIALFTNSASGWIADAFSIHREVFLSGLMLLTVGTCSVYFLPSDENLKNDFHLNVSTPIGGILSNGTKYNTKASLALYYEAEIVDGSEIIINPVTTTFVPREELLSDSLQQMSFWLAFSCLLIQHIGMGISIIFTDAVCFKVLGSCQNNYGKQCMWGTIGMGLFSPIIGALIDWYSRGLPEQDFYPAFVICLLLMFLDIILVSRMSIPPTNKNSFQCTVLKDVLLSPDSVLFLLMIIVYGFSCGINWTFRLILIEDVALEYDPKFPNLKLLLGLVMAVETFGGELPFLFFSGNIIKFFGHVTVSVVCLISIFFRYFLYYILNNPWFFLLVEILNGPSYGLFYANMVSHGTSISPPESLATVHAFIRSSFSAGQCIGGLIGGTLYNTKGGRYTFLIASFITFGFTCIYLLVQFLFRICKISITKPITDCVDPSLKTPQEEQI